MKRYLSTFFKAVVSIFFVYLVARNVDVSAIGSIFKNVSIPFLLWILFMEFLVTVLIAFRWYLILYDFKEKWSFFEIWKLSLIGLYFNILLPTGSGGDAVKIIYLTRNQQERLKLGTSVVFDRFIGSSTIVFMAILGIFFIADICQKNLRSLLPDFLFWFLLYGL